MHVLTEKNNPSEEEGQTRAPEGAGGEWAGVEGDPRAAWSDGAQHLQEVQAGEGAGKGGVWGDVRVREGGDGGEVGVQEDIEEQAEDGHRRGGCEEGGGDHEASAQTPPHCELQRGVRRQGGYISCDGGVWGRWALR